MKLVELIYDVDNAIRCACGKKLQKCKVVSQQELLQDVWFCDVCEEIYVLTKTHISK